MEQEAKTCCWNQDNRHLRWTGRGMVDSLFTALQVRKMDRICGSCLFLVTVSRTHSWPLHSMKLMHSSHQICDGWHTSPTSPVNIRSMYSRSQAPEANGRFRIRGERSQDGTAAVRNSSTSR